MNNTLSHAENQLHNSNWWVNNINSVHLKNERIRQIIEQLIKKEAKIRDGLIAMSKHKGYVFDSLNNAIQALARVNDDASLGFVETHLQNQIDEILAIREVSNGKNIMTRDEKSLYIFTLQSMIFGLGDLRLQNGKPNNYVPKLIQARDQMYMKASMMGIDPKQQLEPVVCRKDFRVQGDPVLSDFDFLDYNRIMQITERMSSLKFRGQIVKQQNAQTQEQPAQRNVNTRENYGNKLLAPDEMTKGNKFLVEILNRFDMESIKKNPSGFYNFIKEGFGYNNHNNQIYEFTKNVVVMIGEKCARQSLEVQNQQDNAGGRFNNGY